VPTTVWTLPTADDTAPTDPPGTHRAAHTRLPDRIHRVLTAFGHPATTLFRNTPMPEISMWKVGGSRPPSGTSSRSPP